MNEAAVIAATRHWVEKAVIGLNLCPFARAVWVKNQVRIVVSQARHVDGLLDDLDRELDLLAATPAEQIDTTLIVHPTLFPDFLVFNDFLDIADEVVAEHGLEGVIQVAAFHPDWRFEGTEPDDITNATNRAPFATLHLLPVGDPRLELVDLRLLRRLGDLLLDQRRVPSGHLRQLERDIGPEDPQGQRS